MARRIYTSSRGRVVIESFFNPEGGRKIFSHYWQVQLFAAAIAFERGVKCELPDKNGTDIDFDAFKNCGFWPGFINCIALIDKGDADLLLPESEDKRVILFEQYSEAGLMILESEGFADLGEVTLARKVLSYSSSPQV
jgi:dnd system-associated protein 4